MSIAEEFYVLMVILGLILERANDLKQ